VVTFVHHMLQAGRNAADRSIENGVLSLQHALLEVQKTVHLFTSQDIAMLHFAAQTAWAPRGNRASHLAPLREAGFSDVEIHDITNVVCCFSYMNRLADSLGVTTAANEREWAEVLYGKGSFEKHLQWAKRAH